MSITTILAALLLTAVCVLPFIIMKRRGKKAEKKFLQVLFDRAMSNNSEISQYDLTTRLIIGIADASNFIFFVKRHRDKDLITQVDLNRIESCYLNKTTRNSIDGNYSLTDKIELRLAFSDKNSQEAVLEFYNLESDSLSMNGELQLAEKWYSVISGKLPQKKSK
jgi:hypothetical protein